jgi:CRISPR-associated protein Cas2
MVVMVLQKNPPAVRGDLTRWLIEVTGGVYIGHVNAMVRDRLWERCAENRGVGQVFQAWSSNNEQHFQMRMAGFGDRKIVDMEGIELVWQLKEELSKAQSKRIKKIE